MRDLFAQVQFLSAVFYLETKLWNHEPGLEQRSELETVETHSTGYEFPSGKETDSCCQREEFLLMRILSGIPQSSLLGRILFILYINTVGQILNSIILLFADDKPFRFK